MDENKDKLISNIYYSPGGYGSVKNTYNDVVKKDFSITLDYVKDWFKRNIERTTQLKGFNSYVAPRAYYENQVDLFFMPENNEEYDKALLLVDIFSKFIVVVPIKTKSEGDLLAGMIEGIKQMGKKPTMIYSDDEGACRTKSFIQYFKDNNITHIITRTHAPVAERSIRTIKEMIYKRLKGTEKPWNGEPLTQTLITYNYKLKHSATGFTPNEGREKKNELTIKLKLQMNAKRDRNYPNISVGDDVKVYKKKDKFDKG